MVICGRNAELAAALTSGHYPEGMRVIVKGFVDNMHEWMGACDAIITKARFHPVTGSDPVYCPPGFKQQNARASVSMHQPIAAVISLSRVSAR